ncbi:6-phosphofructokinase (predicted) [Planoprotostelium fungivorum]|uniref:ATP-dependent 6-phosphofructokinase n=1 Tax=Planoprotostelium fungivorum TaxID=1890364 RepID=A0A2P6NJF7_9EUKA|nr:6-phosphofructokinase (predicted) [Planoprotostelium fungivorum]
MCDFHLALSTHRVDHPFMMKEYTENQRTESTEQLRLHRNRLLARNSDFPANWTVPGCLGVTQTSGWVTFFGHQHMSGVAHFSLIASTPEIFNSTVSFYTALGFSEVVLYDVYDLKSVRQPEHADSSQKETWLHSFGSSGLIQDDITLKIRLCPGCDVRVPAPNPQAEDISDDLRARRSSVSLFVNNLQTVIDKLKELSVHYQCRPDENSPVEIHVMDPTGLVLGFTNKENSFASRSTRKPQKLEPTSMMKDIPKLIEEISQGKSSEKRRKRIGVMTSGGDSQGMSAAVRAVVRMSYIRGCEPYGIYEGYEGLVQGGDLIKKMQWQDVRGWLSEGGTLIGTARCASFRERPGRLTAAKNLILAGIDALVICGGDGSLTGADIFRAEWSGLVQELISTGQLTEEQCAPYRFLTIVGLVGSIDNDMASTDATIGAYSSLTRICEAVDSIFATAYSHSRAFVVEVMGRHCGWLALMAGLSTGADFVFIPEHPPQPGWEDNMCKVLAKHRQIGKRTTIIIVAEGAIDTNLQPIKPNYIKDICSQRLNLDTRVTTLGHTQRGGVPCFFDRMLATLQGVEAVQAVLDATPDTPSPMIGINENRISRKPLMEAVRLTHSVAKAIESKDFDKAIGLRDPEFVEHLDAFRWTNAWSEDIESDFKLPPEKRLRIAIIHVGAPAGGMNAATRAAARYCINRGHTPLAVYNGFPGLCRHEAVSEADSLSHVLDWMDVEDWIIRGGSEIGTNRATPDMDLGTTAYMFQKHKFDAVMIVGGFEAFVALGQLTKARSSYPAFRIPMVCLPATISNNVPATEYSLGSDTALNVIVHYCDTIKQSASASRRRVFIVEVQGGRSGYLSVLSGLTVGALAIYSPEEGIKLKTLADDADYLRKTFAREKGEGRHGKLLIRNEMASQTYTTEVIGKMYEEESEGRYETRTSVLGHVQQGGNPSPMDRVRATRLAVRCMHFLEDCAYGVNKVDDNSTVIGVKGSAIVFTNILEAEEKEADMKNRISRNNWWAELKQLSDLLQRGTPELIASNYQLKDLPL